MRVRLITAVFALSTFAFAEMPQADSHRGAEFFKKQGCVSCHAIAPGAGTANTPARRINDYTPAGIAAGLWNHAPLMWSAMQSQGLRIPEVSEQDAADLYAHFYATRYFEKLADAGRGKKAFEGYGCSGCHALTGQSRGPAVASWQALGDYFSLAAQMWNHSPKMKVAMEERKLSWPELTSQDLADIVVYLRNLPETRNAPAAFVLPPLENGATLFKEKGCAGCHTGALSLENRLSNDTLSDIAASLWNHAPKMKTPPQNITVGEMQQILTYVWARQFFEPGGSAARGKKVFAARQCASCHDGGGAPDIRGKQTYTPVKMVNVLWKHGPKMLSQMESKHLPWPKLTPTEMLDLMAYLSEGSKRASR
jgi:mono/diheme cytochrome c family protein